MALTHHPTHYPFLEDWSLGIIKVGWRGWQIVLLLKDNTVVLQCDASVKLLLFLVKEEHGT